MTPHELANLAVHAIFSDHQGPVAAVGVWMPRAA